MSVNVNDNGNLKRIAGGTLYADAPVGTIQAYGGAVDSSHQAPVGWLLCNGAELLKADYAELYAVIGDAFGTASANTKFVLPDLRGEFLRGSGTNSHTDQGNGGTVGQHQDATSTFKIGVGTTSFSIYTKSDGATIHNADSSSNATQFLNTSANKTTGTYADMEATFRPTNTSVNYIIKAKQVALPVDLENAVQDAYAEVNAYSTTEEIPIGKWIDGKTIYRKVFQLTGSIVYQANVWTDTDITYSSLDASLCLGASMVRVNSGYEIFVCASAGRNSSTGKLRIATTQDLTLSNNGYLIIEYTKAT